MKIEKNAFARAVFFAFLSLVLLPLGGCCGDCCDGCEIEEVTEERAADEPAQTWVVGYRFFCDGSEHLPRGLWRGDLVHGKEAATRLAELHRRRWGCDLADTKIRAER